MIITVKDVHNIQGEGEGKHSDRVVVSENLETLVQFRVRVAQNLV